jgi:drug/metabolite transporter (DMT)-like permease
MLEQPVQSPVQARSMHSLGVACALTAGAWLGSAEAPTKLVTTGYSPILISLCMVCGVFVARWTLPTLMRGTAFVFQDTARRSHLIVWGIFAGALWAVANTLTVIAIRDVGLSIAFPLWNTNSLVGIFWGWLLFGELRGGGMRCALKILGGTVAIIGATVWITFASTHSGGYTTGRAFSGLLAALGASLMWGTMYIPYRKAYLSGMNPLSFVTIFTVGELGAMGLLTCTLGGGLQATLHNLDKMRPDVFWIFLGGFCWVIGDLFQHYATKYIGISRGIPLSNTNQFWGLAWGALVFGELATLGQSGSVQIVLASLLMILGALAIASTTPRQEERPDLERAIERECNRYQLDYDSVLASQYGLGDENEVPVKRKWWDIAVVLLAIGIFVWLAIGTRRPPLAMNGQWVIFLTVALLVLLAGTGWALWKRTRFS